MAGKINMLAGETVYLTSTGQELVTHSCLLLSRESEHLPKVSHQWHSKPGRLAAWHDKQSSSMLQAKILYNELIKRHTTQQCINIYKFHYIGLTTPRKVCAFKYNIFVSREEKALKLSTY